MLNKGLRALPMAGMIAGGFATGGAGFLPSVAGATLGAIGGGAVEEGARTVLDKDPSPNLDVLSGRLMTDAVTGALTETGGRGLTGALEKTLGRYFNPERLYQSALMPRGTSQAEATPLVKTGLTERVPLNLNAAQRTEVLRDRFIQDVRDVISNNPRNIDTPRLIQFAHNRFNALRTKWGNVPVLGPGLEKEVDAAEKAFEEQYMNPGTPGTPGQPATAPIPPGTNFPGQPGRAAVPPAPGTPPTPKLVTTQAAQDTKTAAYEYLRATKGKEGGYVPGRHAGVDEDVQKEIAASLKEELEHVYPGLDVKNARYGDMAKLNEAVDEWTKRFFQSGTREGLPPMGPTELALHMFQRMTRSPQIKSRLGIFLKSQSQTLPGKILIKTTPPVLRNVPRLGTYALNPDDR
jgi:hypothetical protein